jgi:hypothetical protein
MPNFIDLMMGSTPQQLREKFYNERLPQIANEFLNADPANREAHQANGLKLMQEAGKAGLSEDEYGKILNHLTAPARAKTATHVYGEIDSDRKQRGERILEQNITGDQPFAGAGL